MEWHDRGLSSTTMNALCRFLIHWFYNEGFDSFVKLIKHILTISVLSLKRPL